MIKNRNMISLSYVIKDRLIKLFMKTILFIFIAFIRSCVLHEKNIVKNDEYEKNYMFAYKYRDIIKNKISYFNKSSDYFINKQKKSKPSLKNVDIY